MPTVSFADGVPVSSGMPPTYVTADEADDYFRWRLNSDVWDAASDDSKCKAIVTATRAIDRLNFAGVRTSDWARFRNSQAEAGLVMGPMALDPGPDSPAPGQPLEFPRNGSADTPADVKAACCELAAALLDGVDPEMEMQNLGAASQRFSSTGVSFDTAAARAAYRHGIMSHVAWNFLYPYLADPLEINTKRVS